MRIQSKPFVVEVKRSRKTTARDRSPVSSFLVEAEPPASPTPPDSSKRTSAEDLFRDLVDPSYLSRDEKRDGTETQPNAVGNAASNLNRPAADRILPDLTWRDPLKADEELAPRRTKKAGVSRQRVAAIMIQPMIDHDPVRKDAPAAKSPRRKSRPDGGGKSPGPIPAMDSADLTVITGLKMTPSANAPSKGSVSMLRTAHPRQASGEASDGSGVFRRCCGETSGQPSAGPSPTDTHPATDAFGKLPLQVLGTGS